MRRKDTGARTPPLLCVFCGAEVASSEPCPRCARPVVSGRWVETEPGRLARVRAVRNLLLLVFPWLLPVSWIFGASLLVLAAVGVPLPPSFALTPGVARGPILVLVIVMPIMAYVLASLLRELTVAAIGDLRDTRWRFEPERAGPTVRATTRGGRLRSAEGSVVLCEGAPVGGVDVSSQGVVDAGLAAVAVALGEDPRDVLVMAAFAGMSARGELEVRSTRKLRWRHGEAPSPQPSGWNVRLVAAGEPAGPVERALVAALRALEAEAAPVDAPLAKSAYRSATVAASDLGATSIFDVWSTAYAAAPATGEARGSSDEGDVVARLRSWAASEPEFHRTLVDLGTSHRSD